MTNTKTDKEIRPSGATHKFDSTYLMGVRKGWYLWFKKANKWRPVDDIALSTLDELRSLDDIDELVSLREQLADLKETFDILYKERDWFSDELESTKAELVSVKIPDMFWDADNPENSTSDPRDIFDNYLDVHSKIGMEVKMNRAVSCSDATYVLTKLTDDDGFEIELKQTNNESGEG